MRDAAAPARSHKDGGTAKPSAPPGNPPPNPSEPPSPTPAADAGVGAANEPAPTAGSGGAAGDQVAGAGAAGSGLENLRQSLIDAAIAALGGGTWDGGTRDGGAWDGAMQPWRTGGQQAGGLSAEFVKSVLNSMVASGVCFVATPRCLQVCVVISLDCMPCSEDAECAETLDTVCGWFGGCGNP